MINVIYVDDEPDLLVLAKYFLTKDQGYNIDPASSVREAIALLNTRPCDVIISDYEMPVENGLDFLKIVKVDFPQIPFVLFTGRARQEVIDKAQEYGATYVQKGSDVVAMFIELKQRIREGVDNQQLNVNAGAMTDFVKKIVMDEHMSMDNLLVELCNLAKIKSAYIAIKKINEKNEVELRIEHSLGISDDFKKLIVPIKYGLGGEVLRTGKGKIIKNYQKGEFAHLDGIDGAVKKEGIASAMAVAIPTTMGNVGILYLFSKEENQEFDQKQLILASFFGSIIGNKINREKKIKEEEDLKNNLIEANERLNLLTSNSRHSTANKLMEIYGFTGLIIQELEEMNLPELEKIKKYAEKIKIISESLNRENQRTKIYQESKASEFKIYDIDGMENLFKDDYPNLIIINNARKLRVRANKTIMIAINCIIDNTVRHGGKKATQIKISFEVLPNGKVLFICEDNGVGIEYESKDKIFDKGFGKNTGLGLYMTKVILAINNMEIKETGVPGEGARFEILIPAESYSLKE